MGEASGVLKVEYHYRRLHKRSHSYRLWRRGIEVARVLRTHCPTVRRLLDIGTADGLMVHVLQKETPALRVVGLDRSLELLQIGDRTCFLPLLADAARLPFSGASFDAVSAAAVMEHLPEPMAMLVACYRVLRPGGLCVATTPDPFFERIATWIGHLPKEQHSQTFDLALLKAMFGEAGFEVVEASKFMLSPVGFPSERRIERMLRGAGLGRVLLNQIVAGRHPVDPKAK